MMRLIALALVAASIPVLGQNNQDVSVVSQPDQNHAMSGAPVQQRLEALRVSLLIRQRIALHQSFQLDDSLLGQVLVTATAVESDGQTIILTGVELKTDGVIVTSDKAVFDMATRQIEPRGNVHLKLAPSQ